MESAPSFKLLLIGVSKVAAVLAMISLAGIAGDLVLRIPALPLGGWQLVGAVPVTTGVLLEGWATRTFWMAGRGTPHPAGAPRRLVTVGPYARSRNPLYVARLWILFGLALLSESVGILALALLLFLTLEWWLLPHEEARLRQRYGEAYDAYCRRVPRWMGFAPLRRVPPGRS